MAAASGASAQRPCRTNYELMMILVVVVVVTVLAVPVDAAPTDPPASSVDAIRVSGTTAATFCGIKKAALWKVANVLVGAASTALHAQWVKYPPTCADVVDENLNLRHECVYPSGIARNVATGLVVAVWAHFGTSIFAGQSGAAPVTRLQKIKAVGKVLSMIYSVVVGTMLVGDPNTFGNLPGLIEASLAATALRLLNDVWASCSGS